MAVPSGSWPWQPPRFKKDFLHGLAVHHKNQAEKRAKLLGWDLGKGKSKMASGLFNIGPTFATTTTGTANTVWIQNTATSTVNQYAYLQAQQQAQINQQMAAMQNAGMGGLGAYGGGGGSGQLVGNPYNANPPHQLSDEEATAHLRHRGHVVLKKMRRAVHTRLMHAHGGLARINFDALTPLPALTVRELDGYALPAERSEYVMPDGSVLLVDDYGNYRIEDHEAKVTYKANRNREWNPYVSASDLLEAFVGEVGKHPLVNQMNVLKLPVEAFVNWLIVQAAKKDGDSLSGLPTVEDALLALPAPMQAAA
jgi:hypothetical protein